MKYKRIFYSNQGFEADVLGSDVRFSLISARTVHKFASTSARLPKYIGTLWELEGSATRKSRINKVIIRWRQQTRVFVDLTDLYKLLKIKPIFFRPC